MSVTRRSIFALVPSLFAVPVVASAKVTPSAAELDEDRRAAERMCATLAQLREEYSALDSLPTLVVRYPRLWRSESHERLRVAMTSSGWRKWMLLPDDVHRIEYEIIGPSGGIVYPRGVMVATEIADRPLTAFGGPRKA